MKKVFHVLTILSIVCVCAVCFTSCSEKNKALRDLEQLAEDVQENGASYGFSEWKEVYHQYQAINVVIDRNYSDYSQKQRSRIMKARGEIKQAAWDNIMTGLDMFPSLKQSLIDLFNKVFGAMGADAGQEATGDE